MKTKILDDLMEATKEIRENGYNIEHCEFSFIDRRNRREYEIREIVSFSFDVLKKKWIIKFA